jgi:hypothetical protein
MKATDNGFERFPEDFHADMNTAFIKVDNSKFNIGKACIVCGEHVELTENEKMSLHHGRDIDSKMCYECRLAIMHMRRQMRKDL